MTPARPKDFHDFRPFAEEKEYIGLIYADANNMGKCVTELEKLGEYERFAENVDRAIHQAMSRAIKKHLPIEKVTRDKRLDEVRTKEGDAVEQGTKEEALFPFDIFLVGGDDIVMLTDAAKAMDVALTIAQEFRKITNQKHSLSVGVVLAPIKYPFRSMLGLVEEVLKEAKKASAEVREQAKLSGLQKTDIDDTRISFRIVNGGTQIGGDNPYYRSYQDPASKATRKEKEKLEFYATLRPYSTSDLELLLHAIRDGQVLNLGRTKLHQLRKAILKMNTTTSVSEGIAVLRNWKTKQREHIIAYHSKYGSLYQQSTHDPNHPLAGLPRITFPWFLEGDGYAVEGDRHSVYRTALLDLAELYNFVYRKEGSSNEQ